MWHTITKKPPWNTKLTASWVLLIHTNMSKKQRVTKRRTRIIIGPITRQLEKERYIVTWHLFKLFYRVLNCLMKFQQRHLWQRKSALKIKFEIAFQKYSEITLSLRKSARNHYYGKISVTTTLFRKTAGSALYQQ